MSPGNVAWDLTGTKSKSGFQFITQTVKIINKPTISTADDCHSTPTPPSPSNSPPPLSPPSPRTNHHHHHLHLTRALIRSPPPSPPLNYNSFLKPSK
nr:hypothetical protein [Tanacetum cinerariifolium]